MSPRPVSSLRFWAQFALGVGALAVALLTVMWRDWIEIAIHVDPDRHSGSLEWTIAASFAIVAALSLFGAGRAWHRRRRWVTPA